jgi:hypothetical protein
MDAIPEALLDKLKSLPPDRLAEVEDFIDFVRPRARDRALTALALAASESALAMVWYNAEDAAYDEP